MEKPITRFEQVKAVLRQSGPSRYATFRESLRVLIPYEWRRRAVNLVRSRFGVKIIADLISARLLTDKTPLQVQVNGNYAYITHPLDEHISVIDLKQMKVSDRINISGGNGIVYISR